MDDLAANFNEGVQLLLSLVRRNTLPSPLLHDVYIQILFERLAVFLLFGVLKKSSFLRRDSRTTLFQLSPVQWIKSDGFLSPLRV
jgi:hypothetical protein